MATASTHEHDDTPQHWRARHAGTIRQWRLYAHLFRRNFSSMLGLFLVLLFLLLALLGPSLAPYPEDAMGAVHLEQRLQPPTLGHPFGTDDYGRDLLIRVLEGGQVSLMIGFLGALVAGAIGVLYGAVAGFAGAVRADA